MGIPAEQNKVPEMSIVAQDKILKLEQPKNQSLSIRQKKAIGLAITGKIWSEIAPEIGVTTKCIRTWRKQAVFQAELERCRKAYLEECTDLAKSNIQKLSPEAIECLKRAMAKGGGPGVKAALAICHTAGVLKPVEQDVDGEIVVEFGDVELPKDEPSVGTR